ncbi:MAG: peptidase, partial [Pseudomonadota bacterium]|nr:peptidase [Pseudomonadota bacterium]
LDAMALPEVAAAHSLSLLFNSQRINRLAQQQARSDAFYGLDALLAQTYQQVFEQKTASGMAGKISQRVQLLTAKQFADLVASNEVAPEVQAQLRYYLAKLAKSYQQESMLGSVSVGNSAFKQYLSEQISHFLENGEWPANFKVLPMPPGSPI